MNTHKKKMVAPILIVVFIILYYIIVGIALILFDAPGLVKVIILGISSIVAIIFIFVLIERIKEIKGGEEDDLGKY